MPPAAPRTVTLEFYRCQLARRPGKKHELSLARVYLLTCWAETEKARLWHRPMARLAANMVTKDWVSGRRREVSGPFGQFVSC
jgi:hypothetical protein